MEKKKNLALIEKEQPKATINEKDRTEKNVWCTCRADELSAITLAASRRARLAFCSPSAAITYKKKTFESHLHHVILTDGHLTLARASRAASASAAMALCSWTGRRTSLLQVKRKRKFHPRLRSYNNYSHCRPPPLWRFVWSSLGSTLLSPGTIIAGRSARHFTYISTRSACNKNKKRNRV